MGVRNDREIELFAFYAQAAVDSSVALVVRGIVIHDGVATRGEVECDAVHISAGDVNRLADFVAAVVPGDDLVMPGRDVFDLEISLRIGAGEVSVGGYEDDGA